MMFGFKVFLKVVLFFFLNIVSLYVDMVYFLSLE